MDARTRITRNVRASLTGTTITAAAQAADLDPQTLTNRLHGSDELTVTDLILVGGFSRTHPNTYLEGIRQ